MKVNITIKITPDPDKDGIQKEAETLEAEVTMSPGFSKLFPTDQAADMAREYAINKMQETTYRPMPDFGPEH